MKEDRRLDKALLQQAKTRIHDVMGESASRWLLIDVQGQRLLLIENDIISRRYGVSTAAVGVNAREGSFGTPPGVHRLARKIGTGRMPGTRFESREPQTEVWQPPIDGSAGSDRDLILSRIITLRGCEEGVNRGPGCDSEDRFIYIHGTNHEAEIGKPVSHGCIRMSNTDVINLFEQVQEGDPLVVI
jgi:UDP-N-acetylmuramate--alanine ligase